MLKKPNKRQYISIDDIDRYMSQLNDAYKKYRRTTHKGVPSFQKDTLILHIRRFVKRWGAKYPKRKYELRWQRNLKNLEKMRLLELKHKKIKRA